MDRRHFRLVGQVEVPVVLADVGRIAGTYSWSVELTRPAEEGRVPSKADLAMTLQIDRGVRPIDGPTLNQALREMAGAARTLRRLDAGLPVR